MTGGDRLNNEGLSLLSGKLRLEIVLLVRQDPRLGKEVVLFLEVSLHALQIPAQVVLVRQAVHTWVVVDSLIRLHLVDTLRLQARVCPVQVPIGVLVRIHLIIEATTRLLDHTVLGLSRAQNELLLDRLFLRFIVRLVFVLDTFLGLLSVQ